MSHSFEKSNPFATIDWAKPKGIINFQWEQNLNQNLWPKPKLNVTKINHFGSNNLGRMNIIIKRCVQCYYVENLHCDKIIYNSKC